MLKPGDLVASSYFPEVVKLKKCVPYGDYYLLEAVGQETEHFYELVVEYVKLGDFQVIQRTTMVDARDIQKYIQYLLIKNEIKFSNTKALGNNKILPLPHQIDAVYGRMLQLPQIRFLLADDPGAGKTIMAGMLITELIARMMADRVLILVPPLVLTQWQEELYQKFGLPFRIINRSILKEYGNKNPFIDNQLIITSMYWAVRDDVKHLIQEAPFDFIIVDEAHKMAAYTHGKNHRKVFRTKLYQLGENILRKANHVLLLTATPHKGDSENFRHLMKLVDKDVFSNPSVNSKLKEITNPFMIRRLKENLKNFDGTPIFPKRTTKTIQFELTDGELDLYNAVTEYVREYFNKALKNGSQSTAFAMMLLQRRLSSSIDAIYLSLKRRCNRLIKLYKQTESERAKFLNKMKKLEMEHYLEESNDDQEKIETVLEQSVFDIDIKELKKEILVLQDLIKKAEHIKLFTIEKKYQELEETLFGLNGLLQQNEKIIIFTESVDTLHYLEEKLMKQVPKVAKIIGSFSMEKRREQVELFRNECQIMLATDAGGESINLQFCNQMINYDIPWNPNKLEQRMGRIHRIGQKNEVFIFNLVAKNTREGNVLIKLLDKMEQMRKDLGTDAVYDFVGEVLEDQYNSLADLMQKAIIEREKLDEIISGMDRTITVEQKKLLQILHDESILEDQIDLKLIKQQKNTWEVLRIPKRFYSDFTTYVLEKKRVRVLKTNDNKIMRIEKLPKFIRDQIKGINEDDQNSYRYTNSIQLETEDIPILTDTHPLFIAALELMKNDIDREDWKTFRVMADIPEPLLVEIYDLSIKDGTGKTLENVYISIGQRDSGDIIELNANWIFLLHFSNDGFKVMNQDKNTFMKQALDKAFEIRDSLAKRREKHLFKIQSFIEKAFNQQYRETLDRLEKYQKENLDHRNSALINQMNARLIDLDIKKEERLLEISRQSSITIKPPKKVISLEVIPNERSKRVIASDYHNIIVNYEKNHGRLNVRQYENLGLIDFSSERFNGEERFIILTTIPDFRFSDYELEDLDVIKEKVFIYLVDHDSVIKEIPLKTLSIGG